jgi:FkbM family methyltransferase
MSPVIKSLALNTIAAGLQVPENLFNRYLELFHLRKLLNFLEINCVLDVGANCGQFSSELRKIGYRGRIISFEPVKRVFSTLENQFKNDPMWQGFQFALGSENKSLDINVFSNMTVLSSILKPIGKHKNIEIETIEVKRLDDVLPQILKNFVQPKIFLKMDTQGYDLEVFKGSIDNLQFIRGLQSEISVKPLYQGMPHYLEALKTYESSGFDLYNLSIVSRLAHIGNVQELNCFMLRPPL